MNGQKGLAIAITALLLTVCIGYLFNAEQTQTTATVYKDQADMGAIFYENSSRVSGTEVYNPVTNVTDWLPTGAIPTTTTASQYIISSTDAVYSGVLSSSQSPYTMGQDWTLTTYYGGLDNYMPTYRGEQYRSSTNIMNGEELHGGTTYHVGNAGIQFKENGTNASYLYFSDITSYRTFGDLDKLENRSSIILDYSVSASGNVASGATFNITYTATDTSAVEYFLYNETFGNWNAYDSNDNYVATYENIGMLYDDPASSKTISYYTVTTPATVTYADPTQLIDATSSTYARWNSNTDLEFTKVTMVTTIPTQSYVYKQIYAYGENGGGAIAQYQYGWGTVTVNVQTDYNVWESFILSKSSAIKGIQFIFDTVNQTVTIEGITSFDTVAPRLNYTLTGVSYTYDTYYLADPIQYINCLSAGSNPLTTKYAIVETEVLTDPRGVLWNDFNVNLNNYFSQYITDSTEGVRVQLGGFVSYGDTLTVNNQTYAVEDGKITVTLTDGLTNQTRTLPLSGLAVDYRNDGHVYLVFTDNLNREVDLGTRANYNIAGSGAWYFSATFNTIEQATASAWDWSTDWSIDNNTTCIIFLGLTIFGLILGLYVGRGNFGIYDWFILIIADIIALTLMVV